MEGEELVRHGENLVAADKTEELYQKAKLDRMIHAVIIIIKANDPRLQNQNYLDYLSTARTLMRKMGMTPIALVTHQDLLKTEQD